MTGTSYPPTVITTDTHEQDTFSNNGIGSCHAAAMPHRGTGHVAELCQDRDDARRRRDGLHPGRAVLQRTGLAYCLRRHRRRQWRHGMHPDGIRRAGKGTPQKQMR